MKRSPLLSVSLRYGAVCGVLALALLVVTYYIGRHPLMISPYLDFRILLFAVFIFFTLKEVRDYYQEGALYFWQGLIGSVLVVVVATIIAAIGIQIFGSLEKEFVVSYVEQMTAYLKTFPKEDIDRIGKEVYDRNLEQLPATNSSILAFTYFMQGLVIGFFVSIIVSAILRKQPKP